MKSWKEYLRSAAQLAVDVLLPEGIDCLNCGTLSRGRVLCTECMDSLEGIRLA